MYNTRASLGLSVGQGGGWGEPSKDIILSIFQNNSLSNFFAIIQS